MKLERIAPVGKRQAFGFCCHSDGRVSYEWEEDVYPESPEGERLREERVGAAMGLRETARALGISPADLSSLEMGRARPVEGWDVVFEELRRRLRGKHEGE